MDAHELSTRVRYCYAALSPRRAPSAPPPLTRPRGAAPRFPPARSASSPSLDALSARAIVEVARLFSGRESPTLQRIATLTNWLRGRFAQLVARDPSAWPAPQARAERLRLQRAVCGDDRVARCAMRETTRAHAMREHELQARLGALQWLTPQHLNLDSTAAKALATGSALLNRACSELHSALAPHCTPSDSAAAITRSCATVRRALPSIDAVVATDDFIPAYVWVLLQARPVGALAALALIDALHDPVSLLGAEGESVTHLRACCEFILTSTAAEVGVAQDDWDARFAIVRQSSIDDWSPTSSSTDREMSAQCDAGDVVVLGTASLHEAKLEVRCTKQELLFVAITSAEEEDNIDNDDVVVFRWDWSRVLRWRAEAPPWLSNSHEAARSTLRLWVWRDEGGGGGNGRGDDGTQIKLICNGPHAALALAHALLRKTSAIERLSRGAIVEYRGTLLKKRGGTLLRKGWCARYIELGGDGSLAYWANAEARGSGDEPRGRLSLRGDQTCVVRSVLCRKGKYFYRFCVEKGDVAWHFRAHSKEHLRDILAVLIAAGALGLSG